MDIKLPGTESKMIANNLRPSYLIHPGEMIRDEIEYRGITQKQLAEEIGMPRSVVNAILKGKRAVSTQFALLLEAALGIDADIWLKLQSDYDKSVTVSAPSFMARLKKIRAAASFL